MSSLNQPWTQQLQAAPLATVCEHYARCLANNPKAIEFLKRHALYCQSLPIGFADRSLGTRIAPKASLLGKSLRSQLTHQ